MLFAKVVFDLKSTFTISKLAEQLQILKAANAFIVLTLVSRTSSQRHFLRPFMEPS